MLRKISESSYNMSKTLLPNPWISTIIGKLIDGQEDNSIRSSSTILYNSPKLVQVIGIYDSLSALRINDSENYITVMLTTDCMETFR